MVIDRIYISVSPGETRIAELEDGQLAGLTVHRVGAESRVGDIYVGRVEAVIHNLQAAFVDIGEERSGFLALPEVRTRRDSDEEDQIGDYLSEGDRVLVQVMRDAEEDKGAKLTTRVSLSGRDLVFAPQGRGISVSRRIGDSAERERLTAAVQSAAGQDGTAEGAYIVRTAAAEAEDDDLAAEVARLQARWAEIEAARDQGSVPAAVHRDAEPALRILRERGGADLQTVSVDDAALFQRMTKFVQAEMPDLAEALHHHAGPDDLFEISGVEEMIDAALDTFVPLASGANLLISETPALTAIDVNTGGADFGNRERTALEVNKEAAQEIAHQIRLRNLSGLLVVDFVSMRQRDAQHELGEVFRAALADDPLYPNLIGFTRLGLAEITRRRQGASLQELYCGEPAPPARSAETTALAALRAAIGAARGQASASYMLEVPPGAAKALTGPFAAALAETRERLGGGLEIVTVSDMAADMFQVKGGEGGGG